MGENCPRGTATVRIVASTQLDKVMTNYVHIILIIPRLFSATKDFSRTLTFLDDPELEAGRKNSFFF